MVVISNHQASNLARQLNTSKKQIIEKSIMLFVSKIEDEQNIDVFKQTSGSWDSKEPAYRQWNPSHGIEINDAFLAATVMHTRGQIFSLNIKHFPMPDIIVKQAW